MMTMTNRSLTKEAVASFSGWGLEELDQLMSQDVRGKDWQLPGKKWDLDSIRRGYANGLVLPKDFSTLDLWDATFLLRGHLWGNEPSETAHLALEKIPDDGTLLEFGFGYGRDFDYVVKRRRSLIGLEKSRIGVQLLMRGLSDEDAQKVEIIWGSMKTHRFAKGSLAGIFSHRVMHLPHPETAVPTIAKNMADAVKPGGTIIVSARSIHDFYQDRNNMTNLVTDSEGFPVSAERMDRAGHKINYFSSNRFSQVFGPYCNIRELYLGKELESQGSGVDSYYITAVMEVLPENERTFPFANGRSNNNFVMPLPSVKHLPSLQGVDVINCEPIAA